VLNPKPETGARRRFWHSWNWRYREEAYTGTPSIWTILWSDCIIMKSFSVSNPVGVQMDHMVLALSRRVTKLELTWECVSLPSSNLSEDKGVGGRMPGCYVRPDVSWPSGWRQESGPLTNSWRGRDGGCGKYNSLDICPIHFRFCFLPPRPPLEKMQPARTWPDEELLLGTFCAEDLLRKRSVIGTRTISSVSSAPKHTGSGLFESIVAWPLR
jgi:hypothetical protein